MIKHFKCKKNIKSVGPTRQYKIAIVQMCYAWYNGESCRGRVGGLLVITECFIYLFISLFYFFKKRQQIATCYSVCFKACKNQIHIWRLSAKIFVSTVPIVAQNKWPL